MSEQRLSVTTPVKAPNARRPAFALWVWAALACGLVAAFEVDRPVMAALQPLYGSELTRLIRQTIRWLGIGYVQALVLIIMIAAGTWRWPRVKNAGGWGLLAFAISGAAVDLLKVIVHRPRPYVTDTHPDSWLAYAGAHNFQSFPSGESATTFAIALTLSFWFPRLRVPLIAVAVIVAAARVVVGGHFPSDVWAGAMLGAATAQWVKRTADARRRGSVAAA
jgi:undecaprenyl-diphosphatase